jgi:hydrogenase maturation protease
MEPVKNTLVLGIGNELLCDDGIGLRVVNCAQEKLGTIFPHVAFRNDYSAGFDLLYEMMDVARAIIVDAVCTGLAAPGSCREFTVRHLRHMTQCRLADSHGLNLATILAMGEKLGYSMPGDIVIYGIETGDVTSFSTEPTVAVKSAVPRVVEMIRRTLLRWESSWTKKNQALHCSCANAAPISPSSLI